MRGQYFLGIDVGTEGTKVALFDEEGRNVGNSYEEYGLVCKKPGWAEQDPDVWWNAVVKNVGKVLKFSRVASTDIDGIGVCGQMHAAVPIDKKGQLLYHSPSLWCDKRSIPQCQRLKKELDEEAILKKTANPITPAWTATKILWLKENLPEVYHKTYKFLVPKNYIVFKLSNVSSIDPSEASGTLLFDVNKEKWSDELSEQMGIDLGKMPEINPSHKVIGEVTPETAALTGLRSGVPVVSGGADFMCTLLGAGITSKGRAADIAGDASIVAFYSNKPLVDRRIMNIRHVVEGWIPFGIVEGGLLRWFRDKFGQEEKQAATERSVSIYQIMDSEAEKVKPGSDGLIVVPYFMGERVMGSFYARGTIFGLTLAHEKAHFIRALMEGMTMGLKRTLEVVEELGIKTSTLRLIGGGAVSPLWRQIKADIYGKPCQTLNVYHGGVLGAAILAMVGTGARRDALTAVDEMVNVRQTCKPSLKNQRVYNNLYKIFKEIHSGNQQLFDELSLLNL